MLSQFILIAFGTARLHVANKIALIISVATVLAFLDKITFAHMTGHVCAADMFVAGRTRYFVRWLLHHLSKVNSAQSYLLI